MIRILLVLLVALGVVLTASSCGRKATPNFPPDSDYPRRYPAQ
jgi:predicted small lipoprotein YifL